MTSDMKIDHEVMKKDFGEVFGNLLFYLEISYINFACL